MNKRWWYIIVLLFFAAVPALAQQILLDQPLRAGELILFPDLNDPNVYYYVSDKPHLATGANGTPEFSFLRYVENVRSGADQPDVREGEGGGIVHALVALAVTPEQLRDAQRELRRLKPEAKIQGPVLFKSGRFGLVTSFKDPSGKLSTQVVGLGSAPILDGEKAAVSIQLTKLGAKVLWESFNTPTPDISFSFEMNMTGFRSPKRALIEANFDQIYEHQAFAVGLASTYLAAEIKGAFDDLQRSGAIKVTQVGSDEKMENLITTAYNKIADIMFSPLGGTGTPSLDALTATAGGGTSLLDRATTMLAKNREEARADAARASAATPSGTTPPAGGAQRPAGAGPASPPSGGGQPAAGGGRPAPPAESGPHISPSAREAGVAPPSRTEPAQATAARNASKPASTGPAFAIVAAYEMKRVRQRGTFRIDLNKYTTDELTLRFDQNIGDLRALHGDSNHFREVNISNDPLYVQREVSAYLDGMNAQDFDQFVNFVSVRLRKKHARGTETTDEVRIDRANFNKQGNNFKLMYGWEGDNDRRRWMEYDYQTTWSFFGGKTVEQPWQTTNSGGIPLSPPYQRCSLDIQADPTALTTAGVRAVTVKVFYNLGGSELMKQLTLLPSKAQLSGRLDFMLPAGSYDYGYEVVWKLPGDRNATSGRKTGSDTVLLLDTVPSA